VVSSWHSASVAQHTARVVSLARGAISACRSENVPTEHAGSRHRQIRLRHSSTAEVAKHGASCTR
jgi:hypothetical protein